MKMMSLMLVGCVLACAGAVAAEKECKIAVTGGKTASEWVPVSIPCSMKSGDGVVTVVDPASGKSYPATLNDGELTFVMDSLAANAKVNLEVKVAPKPANYTPRVDIRQKDGADELEVRIDGVLFTTFHYGKEWAKPFLWPVLSEGQVGVTRDFPMIKTEGGTGNADKDATDHKHHKSWWSAYGEVKRLKKKADAETKEGFTDCWAEEEKSGYQVTEKATCGSGDGFGWIRSVDVWESHEHEPLLKLEREYRFYCSPEKARVADVRLVFKPIGNDVKFRDTKEGGLVAFRMRPEICGDKAIITNEFGDKGEKQCWGKPSRWCDFSGDIPGAGLRGVAVLDHPDNLRYPSSWHVRNYGLMGANSFGYSYFAKEKYNAGLVPANGDYVIEKKKPLHMNYRVLVHSGDAKAANVEAYQTAFANPPLASCAK